jgi:branched-chain amino acid transport system substrate-binding protein
MGRAEKWNRVGLALVVATFITACGEQKPILIGFIGGTSGRVADLGAAGRNGAMRAIEQRNAAGGVNGRKAELLIRDDQQSADEGRKIVREFIERKAAAIIGPMTSVVGAAVAPLVTDAKILAISPTVTTKELSGQDDYFFRMIASTAILSKRSADMQLKRGIRTAAVVLDKRNASYTESWTGDFTTHFEAGGGKVVLVQRFESESGAAFADLAAQLVKAKSDAIVLVTNSVDAALLAQQVRKINAKVQMFTPEWAATEKLIELGGRAVEGVVVAQYFDRDSARPAYQAFRRAYQERFGSEPGFPGLLGYEATVIALAGLAQQQGGEDLKQTLLRLRTFEGVLGPSTFDRFGDTEGRTYFAEIRGDKFVVIE